MERKKHKGFWGGYMWSRIGCRMREYIGCTAKKGVLIATGITFCAACCTAQGLPPAEQHLLETAVEKADGGEEREAIEILRGLLTAHPDDAEVMYELGYAYYRNAEWGRTVELMRKLRGLYDKNGNEKGNEKNKGKKGARNGGILNSNGSIVWQMEGNALDRSGRRGDALRTYREGLKRFPRSANLLMEIGNIHFLDENYEQALDMWLRGIEADATFGANYQRAAELLLQSSEPAEGLFLAEAYRWMEPTGEASQALGALMAEALRTAITVEGNRIEVGLTMRAPCGEAPEPLGVAMEQGAKNSMRALTQLARQKKLTLKAMADLKEDVLEWLNTHEWEGSGTARRVVAMENAVLKAGHWTAYCMWLLRMGDEEEFNEWMVLRERDMERFAEWYAQNRDRF